MSDTMKKECIFGICSVIIFVILIGISVYRYNHIPTQIQNTLPPSSVQLNSVLTPAEIAKHSMPNDCWVITENKVYDIDQYLNLHPGGAGQIIPYCGADATVAFQTRGGNGTHSLQATQELALFYIGDLNERITAEPNQNAIDQLPVGRTDDDD